VIAPAQELDFRALLARGEGAQVVAFRMGGELHGCDIRLVEEVVTRQRIHPLPDVPPHLLGMILLRGEMVPVVDVSAALGLSLSPGGARPILVAGVGGARVGVAADAVHEVMEVPAEALRPAPHAAGEAYVVGVARLAPGLVTLIDLAELLRERTTLDTRTA
jgi:purine-binding chemotaxis protein CheW